MLKKFAVLAILMLIVMGLLPSQTILAADKQSSEDPACAVNNVAFPEVMLGGDSGNKFVEIIHSFDEDCNMIETSRRILTYVPEEVAQVNNANSFSETITMPPPLYKDGNGLGINALLPGTNTAHVRIYELDCCGIHTIELQTDQT